MSLLSLLACSFATQEAPPVEAPGLPPAEPDAGLLSAAPTGGEAEAAEYAEPSLPIAEIAPSAPPPPRTVAYAPRAGKTAPAEEAGPSTLDAVAPAPAGVDGEGLAGGSVAWDARSTGSAAYDRAESKPKAAADRGDTSRVAARGAPSQPVRQAAPLRAGATDDNADYQAFLTFLGTWSDDASMRGRYQPVNVYGRRTIEVRDARGGAVPGATVEVGPRVTQVASLLPMGSPGWTGQTYGDGETYVYPAQIGAQGPYRVTASLGRRTTSVDWDGKSDLRLDLPTTWNEPQAVPLDVVFLLDTTGSMGDELDRIKATLLATTERLRRDAQEVDLRYGAVLYRDQGDDYVTDLTPLTADLTGFERDLSRAAAGGGGDYPEALNEGLSAAVHQAGWRYDAAKVVFLVADAPPQMQQGTPYGTTALAAARDGIRVHTVAASGLDPAGTLAFRQIAQLTRGQFIFIEYGSSAASAARHGVSSQVSSNNLDEILYRRLRAEIDGFGR